MNRFQKIITVVFVVGVVLSPTLAKAHQTFIAFPRVIMNTDRDTSYTIDNPTNAIIDQTIPNAPLKCDFFGHGGNGDMGSGDCGAVCCSVKCTKEGCVDTNCKCC